MLGANPYNPSNKGLIVYYAIIQKQGEHGVYETTARRGGFKLLETAIKCCIKYRNGHVIDDNRKFIAVVANGVDLTASQLFPHPDAQVPPPTIVHPNSVLSRVTS